MKRLLIKHLGTIVAICLLLGYAVCFRTAEVTGTSMVPTFDHADLLLVRRLGEIHYGDVVTVYSEQLNEMLIKRVVGVAGDRVVVDDTGLNVNGVLIEEEYTSTSDWYTGSAKVDLTVPDGEVFVLGTGNFSRKLKKLSMRSQQKCPTGK